MAAKKTFVPTAENIGTLIGKANIICKTYLNLLVDTGSEPYEISQLFFQDVDVSNSTVTLTKASGQRRTVPISLETVNLILALHSRRCKRDSVFENVSGILHEFERLKAVLASEDPRFALLEFAGIRRRVGVEAYRSKGLQGAMELLGTSLEATEELCVVCPGCGGLDAIVKAGKITKTGTGHRQMFGCKNCGHRFVMTLAPPAETEKAFSGGL